jgi:RimJ/RimL family protein N-acetyltransferase
MNSPSITLVPYTDGDIELTAALEQDARVMANLGGPADRERVERVHAKRMAGLKRGDWYLTVVPEDVGRPVGIVAIWRSEVDGREFDEIGLMLLAEYHRKGVGITAMQMAIDRAREERADGRIEAFTGVHNTAATAGANLLGYTWVGERDMDYEGEPLRCNHWVLDLHSPTRPRPPDHPPGAA